MEEKKKGFFARLKEGLTKTRNSIVSGIDSVFRGFTDIDDDFYEEIEEILIMGDLGVDATEKILTDMKQKVKELHLKEPHECKEVLIDSIRRQMDLGETPTSLSTENQLCLSSVSMVLERRHQLANWLIN